MQYTPYASPGWPTDAVTSSSDEDSIPEDLGTCIPASSSTIMPSSPLRDCEADDTFIKSTNYIDSDSIYAPTKPDDRSRLSEELELCFSAKKCHDSDEKTQRPTLLSTGSSQPPSYDASESLCSSHSSNSLYAAIPQCNHAKVTQYGNHRNLETRETQENFSRHLTELLLLVLEKQDRQSDASPAPWDSSSTPADTVSDISAQSLDVPSRLFSSLPMPALIALDASDSLYAADISNSGTNVGSTLSSWSVSACSAGSDSCTSSFSSSSEHDSDFVVDTPDCYAGRYVYGTSSGSDTSRDHSSSCSSFDENMPGYHVFSLGDSLDTIRTPTVSTVPSLIPDAPKKVQHHIRIQPRDTESMSGSSGKKRPRSVSPHPNASDYPIQDAMEQDDVLPVLGPTLNPKFFADTKTLSRQETLRERSFLLAKRRKISMPSRRSKQDVVEPNETKLHIKSLASFRRAASMRSEAQVQGILEDVS